MKTKALKIFLYALTAILCVTMIASLCIWASCDGCASDPAGLSAKDVCSIVLPLIGICVMLIFITNRRTPKKEH